MKGGGDACCLSYGVRVGIVSASDPVKIENPSHKRSQNSSISFRFHL